VQSPKLAGTYYIEVQTMDTTSTVLESYTATLTFTATPLIGLTMLPYPLWQSHKAMHEIAFQTPYEIPASIV
jgi:hypothetical protein